MDVRQKIQPLERKRVLSVAFNDTKSHFAIGLDNGFRVLQTDDASVVVKKESVGSVGLAQMKGISNIIALVGGGSRPSFEGTKVIIWDESVQNDSWEINVKVPVRGVKVGAGHVFVALKNSLQVYDLETRHLVSSYPTADNLGGILCVSDKMVAFPGRDAGQIQMVELKTANVSMVLGHDAPLRVLSFSPEGDMLASASEKGTMVHVYNTRNCALISEVRRGMDPAHIFDLCFSPSGDLIASTSDKGTLHIFDVRPGSSGPESRPASSNSSSSFGNVHNTPSVATNGWGWLAKVPLLPKAFSDTYSFASTKFDLGDEPSAELFPVITEHTTLGSTKPQKGAIGWFQEDDIVVVGGGFDPKWEKFQMTTEDGGKRVVSRIGWKRYYNEYT